MTPTPSPTPEPTPPPDMTVWTVDGLFFVDTLPGIGEVTEWSSEVIKESWPFISMHDGNFVVSAKNGRFRFRPVGRGVGIDTIKVMRVVS